LVAHIAFKADGHGQHVTCVDSMANPVACGTLGIHGGTSSLRWIREGASGRGRDADPPRWGAGIGFLVVCVIWPLEPGATGRHGVIGTTRVVVSAVLPSKETVGGAATPNPICLMMWRGLR
jgi:hypothetical protein